MSAILLAALAILPLSASAGMSPEEVKAFAGYKVAAEKGDVLAQYNLAHCYYFEKGVAKDEVEAVRWCRQSADQGFAKAQGFLGVFYVFGKGVAKDEVEAVRWFRKAADQGFAGAQHNLGICYADGIGVARDNIEAYAYLNLAGITDENARKDLALLEGRMSPDARLLGQQRTKQLQKEIKGRLESAEEIRKATEKK